VIYHIGFDSLAGFQLVDGCSSSEVMGNFCEEEYSKVAVVLAEALLAVDGDNDVGEDSCVPRVEVSTCYDKVDAAHDSAKEENPSQV
jgi:hypothetical protein